MISKAVRDEAMHSMESPAPYRPSRLVAAVEDQIIMNPSILPKFLSVVRRDPSLVYIADAMSDDYRKYNALCALLILGRINRGSPHPTLVGSGGMLCQKILNI